MSKSQQLRDKIDKFFDSELVNSLGEAETQLKTESFNPVPVS